MYQNISLILITLLLTLQSACTGAPMPSSHTNSLDTLESLEWERRIILLRSDKMTRNKFAKALEQSEKEINERHITWFQYHKGILLTNHPGPVSDTLKQEIQTYFSDEAHVILIGKDGTVKDRSKTLDLNAIFAQIDSMPMRIQEMKQQR